MSENEGKRLINKIIIIVVSGLLLNVIVGGFWTWKVSYKNSIINQWQDADIKNNTGDIDELKESNRNMTAQFYIISSDIKEIKNKLK